MINRSIAPEIKKIKDITFIPLKNTILDNGIKLFYLETQNITSVARLELRFKAGIWYENKNLQALFTNNLIKRGTTKHSGNEISELIDFYGATLHSETGKDNSSITLFFLQSYLNKLLNVILEILNDSNFPQNEFNSFVQRAKQKFIINNKKVHFISKKFFLNSLYGKKHPYSFKKEISDFNKITRNDLINFYNERYNPDNCTIFYTGNFNKKVFDLFNKTLGKQFISKTKNDNLKQKIFEINDSNNNTIKVPVKGTLQSSIRIGKRLFNRTNKDYYLFTVLNTILGGYFGSRLMKKIREEKAYTYGISSNIISLLNDGYFVISTEVNYANTSDTIEEIFNEIQKLKEVKVKKKELELVKNYLTGNILRDINGIFRQVDAGKMLYEYNLDNNFFESFIKTINNVNENDILEIANKYLHNFKIIIAGTEAT